ncbi:NAD-dependent epimerase/dehydratase family protein [Rhodovarius crocodyli]|uniref:NAD-dependent epimerase/dehydratase family protein n=1 Tax=Rhodovarius crocodyli TaxID=1979269 RepID=A0A437MNE1_9PROT|nr:D-erythronate dehydrogenase [Rhodovarius crocodyli]RVT99142.1 NAD-dependent epimerase/dehydratase family protein [Rhodovarius crocodyli]
MHITILGGGGFLGRKLAARLSETGTLAGETISSLTLFDMAPPPAPEKAPFPVRCLTGDVADPQALGEAIPPETRVVFQLAAVVSAAAEADFDLGVRVNLQGSLALIEVARRCGVPPRIVFTSSVASFSGDQSTVMADDARQMPLNSYGAEKAAAELMLQDASRRGMLDAVNIRLPTVIVRPGRPNKAASSFVSAILREPLLGLETSLPVDEAFALWVSSPRVVVGWLLKAAEMDTSALGTDRGINPPGLTVTVGEMLAALSPAERALVKSEPDPVVAGIVGGWPARFAATRALALGFQPQVGLAEILQAFREDDLAQTRAERGH